MDPDPTSRRSSSFYLKPTWIAGLVFVFFVVGLFLYSETVFVFFVFTRHLESVPAIAIPLFLFWHFLWGNMVVSYFRCVLTDPGSVPIQFESKPLVAPSPGQRTCETCGLTKPDRTHHCRTCGTCVLKMDHHCPWINNCVGFRNQKFFILFLFYTALTCLCYIGSSVPILSQDGIMNIGSKPGTLQILIICIISFSFGIGLLGFSGVHFNLAIRNQTTLETFGDYNPYDMGRRHNWEQVFGPEPGYWFLPVANSIGNGYQFPTNPRDQFQSV